MRHKMVSLCPTTYEKAQKIENFSKWVRSKLLEDDTPTEEVFKFYAECTRCGTTWSSYNAKRVPHDCGECLKEGHDPKVKRWTERAGDL
jgi:hypothetical protein